MRKFIGIAQIFLMLASSIWAKEKLPEIEVVGPDSIDFGKYPAIEKKTAKYTIRNAGKETLKILKIRKTCGCASATSDKTVLEPNETANVEVVILPNSIFHLYSKNTFVESNDPHNKFLKLNVAGNAIPLVEIKPNDTLHAGRIKTNVEWSQSFDLKGNEPNVKLGNIETKSNYLVETTLTKMEQEKDSHYSLNVKLLPPSESGDFKCSIYVPVLTPSNHPPLKIIVSGNIGYELAAVPGIARLSVSEEPQTRSIVMRVIGQRSRVLEPEELVLPKRDDVSFEVNSEKNGLLVTATFSPEFSKTLLTEEIIPLEFSVPGASSAKLICRISN